MNLGSWVLLVNGGASTTAALLELLGRLKRVKVLAEVMATLAGPPLATYTGVLVADTAVPVWHEGRRELPWIFAASASASAGAAASMFVHPRDAGPARRLAVAGVLAEGALMQAMELRLGKVGEVYRQGEANKFSWAAKGLAVAGVALLARRGRKNRAAAVAGGALVCAGELCLRWAVFKAGQQSARDPKYVVEPQRARVTHVAPALRSRFSVRMNPRVTRPATSFPRWCLKADASICEQRCPSPRRYSSPHQAARTPRALPPDPHSTAALGGKHVRVLRDQTRVARVTFTTSVGGVDLPDPDGYRCAGTRTRTRRRSARRR